MPWRRDASGPRRSVIWKDMRRRLSRPRMVIALGLAAVGLVTWIVLGLNNRASGGAGMWVPTVVVPGVAGVFWIIAGGSWMLLGESRGHGTRCARCRYDLSGLQESDPRCPECGQRGVATARHPAAARWLTQLPGMVCLTLGVLILGLALFYGVLITAGTFDV